VSLEHNYTTFWTSHQMSLQQTFYCDLDLTSDIYQEICRNQPKNNSIVVLVYESLLLFYHHFIIDFKLLLISNCVLSTPLRPVSSLLTMTTACTDSATRLNNCGTTAFDSTQAGWCNKLSAFVILCLSLVQVALASI